MPAQMRAGRAAGQESRRRSREGGASKRALTRLFAGLAGTCPPTAPIGLNGVPAPPSMDDQSMVDVSPEGSGPTAGSERGGTERVSGFRRGQQRDKPSRWRRASTRVELLSSDTARRWDSRGPPISRAKVPSFLLQRRQLGKTPSLTRLLAAIVRPAKRFASLVS